MKRYFFIGLKLAPLLLTLLIGAGLFVLWPTPARATNEAPAAKTVDFSIPTQQEVTTSTCVYSLTFDSGLDGWHVVADFPHYDLGTDYTYTHDGAIGHDNPGSLHIFGVYGTAAAYLTADEIAAGLGVSGVDPSALTTSAWGSSQAWSAEDWIFYEYTDDTWGSAVAQGEGWLNPTLTGEADKTLSKVWLVHGVNIPGGQDYYWDDVTFTLYPCSSTPASSQECPLVPNADFLAADAWLLDGTAAITDSTLLLAPGDIAAQNLFTLDSNKTYSAVISVTEVTAPTSLNFTLGAVKSTLPIAATGLFTIPLTAPADVSGPVLYALENTGSLAEIVIDYTCLSTGDGEQTCLAPQNGTFDTANDWQWYRNAAWESAGKMAGLPYNAGSDGDMALIQAGRSYTMPEVPTGQYLILGYQAQASGNAGLVSSKVGSAENQQQIYKVPYNYEIDISNQAGQSVDLALADTGTSDLLLDNVCVFLSPNPPQLPQPSDPGGFVGADFGFNYTCRDVPALLAGWGINVYGAQDTFDAGVSVWDAENYIPWLAAALWVNAGQPVSCFLVEEMRLIAGVSEQQINHFLNVSFWAIRSANLSTNWLQRGFFYLRDVINSPVNSSRLTASGWLNFGVSTLHNLVTTIGSNWGITIDWIQQATIWLSEAIASGSSGGLALADTLPGGSTAFGLIDLIWSLANLIWSLWSWLWSNVFSVVDIPLQFYYAFNDGIKSEAFGSLMSCANQNFWCGLLAGVQIVNQTAGDTVLYPIVIFGIVLASFAIFWRHIWAMIHIDIR